MERVLSPLAEHAGRKAQYGAFDLLPVLQRFAPPAQRRRQAHPFRVRGAASSPRCDELSADTLIFTGVETDVCVLATAIGAIDRGYRTILISDAMASGSARGP